MAKAQSKKIWERVYIGPLQKGQNQALGSLETTNLPILALEGTISHATFHKKCFSLAWILIPQRVNQASKEKGGGGGLPPTKISSSWANFTEKKRPEKAGAQNHLSIVGQTGKCILRMHWTERGSNKSSNKGLFQTLPQVK